MRSRINNKLRWMLALMIIAMGSVMVLPAAVGLADKPAINNTEECSGDFSYCEVDLPRTEVSTDTVSSIMKIVFGVVGVLSVVFIAIGGFKYTISGGDPAGLTSAKNTILYALVGLGISVSAFVIVQFVIGSV